MEKLGGACAKGALALLVSATALVTAAAPASAAKCAENTPLPTNSNPGRVVVATGFESDELDPFSVNTSGSGKARVSDELGYTGGCSALLQVSADPKSLANLSHALPSGTKSAYADGWFNIAQAGLKGNNVPYFRFFSGGTRVADVYRLNSNGQLWLRVTSTSGDFVYTRLTPGPISLNAWHRVTMHVAPNGNATTIRVWFDGVLRYASNSNSTGATSLSRAQIGAEHKRQMGVSYIDDVVIKAGG
jgi:Concanavalin A-like lectin/glucanases superfamily